MIADVIVDMLANLQNAIRRAAHECVSILHEPDRGHVLPQDGPLREPGPFTREGVFTSAWQGMERKRTDAPWMNSHTLTPDLGYPIAILSRQNARQDGLSSAFRSLASRIFAHCHLFPA